MSRNSLPLILRSSAAMSSTIENSKSSIALKSKASLC